MLTPRQARRGANVTRRDRQKDRSYRRRWLERVAFDRRLTSGCKDWLGLLASRSDDTGKAVWGAQARQADELGRHHGTVRRYRAEAETAGYILTKSADPERDHATGRFYRRHSNTYIPLMPSAEALEGPAPRRRQRYCGPAEGSKSRSHLARTHARSTPVRGVSKPRPGPSETIRPPGGEHRQGSSASQKQSQDLPPPVLGEVATRMADDEYRQKLRRGEDVSPSWVPWRAGRVAGERLAEALAIIERDPDIGAARLRMVLTTPAARNGWENEMRDRAEVPDQGADPAVVTRSLAEARSLLGKSQNPLPTEGRS
ncbi:MAG: hypothetical protein ACYCTI_13120 [Acidimicrobiales bacterium]